MEHLCNNPILQRRGIYFWLLFSIFLGGICFFAFGFLAFWLLGFSASWLLGLLAFWLLGFLAFRLLVGLCGLWWLFGFGFSHPLHSQFLFGRWRFGLCGFSLVYAAFGGFGFSHPLLSQFLSGRFGFWGCWRASVRCSISRENAVKYDMLLARTKKLQKKKNNNQQK